MQPWMLWFYLGIDPDKTLWLGCGKWLLTLAPGGGPRAGGWVLELRLPRPGEDARGWARPGGALSSSPAAPWEQEAGTRCRSILICMCAQNYLQKTRGRNSVGFVKFMESEV